MRQTRTRFFYGDLAGIGQFYQSPFLAIKEMDSICSSNSVTNLLSAGWLTFSLATARVNFLGQQYQCMQLTYL